MTGDTDYVAANAFLLTAAWYANRRQGRDEFTIAWPGWSEVPMAADPAVAAALGRHGVPAGLTPRAGRRAFVELLGMLPSTGGGLWWRPGQHRSSRPHVKLA